MERHEAVILRSRPYREHDRLLTLLSPTAGKRDVLARGSRKIVSKLAASLEPFGRVRVELVAGRSLAHCIGVEVLTPYARLRRSLPGLGQAGFVVAVADALTRSGDAEVRLYQLVVHELERIDRTPGTALRPRDSFALALFALRAVALAGWQPNLDACSVCHRPLGPEPAFFAAHPFGLTHRRCRSDARLAVHPVTRRYLTARLARFSAVRAVVPRTVVREVGQLSLAALTAVAEQPVGARDFLRALGVGASRVA